MEVSFSFSFPAQERLDRWPGWTSTVALCSRHSSCIQAALSSCPKIKHTGTLWKINNSHGKVPRSCRVGWPVGGGVSVIFHIQARHLQSFPSSFPSWWNMRWQRSINDVVVRTLISHPTPPHIYIYIQNSKSNKNAQATRHGVSSYPFVGSAQWCT